MNPPNGKSRSRTLTRLTMLSTAAAAASILLAPASASAVQSSVPPNVYCYSYRGNNSGRLHLTNFHRTSSGLEYTLTNEYWKSSTGRYEFLATSSEKTTMPVGKNVCADLTHHDFNYMTRG